MATNLVAEQDPSFGARPAWGAAAMDSGLVPFPRTCRDAPVCTQLRIR